MTATWTDLFDDRPIVLDGGLSTQLTAQGADISGSLWTGRALLEHAKAAAPTGTKVVAVTMLTSLDDGDLVSVGLRPDPHEQVMRLTELAKSAGVDGIVCSGNEVAAAKALWRDGFFVIPGVRPANGTVGDQKRVVTPRAALDAGASILVIGRPITQAQDPDLAAREIEATL